MTTNDPQDKSAATRQAVGQGLTITAMSLLTLVLLYFILRELAQILRPLLIAVFVGYLIMPVHRWLVHRRVPSAVSYILIAGGFLFVIAAVSNIAFQGANQLSSELPGYIRQLQSTTDDFVARVKDKLNLGIRNDDTTPADGDSVVVIRRDRPASQPAAAEPDSAQGQTWRLISGERLTGIGRAVLQTSLGSATGALVVLLYLIFLLAEATSLRKRIAFAFGDERGENIMRVVGTINNAVSQYLAVKTFTSFLTAVLSFLILAVFGVKYAILWAMLTFFANFVPYVGSMVAVLFPIAMCFVQFQDTLHKPFIVLAMLIGVQQCIGNFIEPRMIGEKLGVSPLIVLLSLAFWGMLWGVPGMILSAPLAVSIKIILENIEQTKPIAKLCSNV